ncbi:MAG: hypothetical protein ORN83_08910 [Chthoniobacteraceae bacterium]|nr:hypothetical protein [Chthoniobacteraceae bacterium]
MFSEFELTIDYKYSAEYNAVWGIAPGGEGDPPVELWATFNDDYDGTWGHKVPKLDFTKRELSCSNVLFYAYQAATDGWAHKTFDFPVMRDFSADYPFATNGATEGYAYYASQKIGDFEPKVGKPNQLPLVNYYALQKYANQTTENPDPEGEPIPVPPEPVPQLNKLRKRQPIIPLLNNVADNGDSFFLYNDYYPIGPFYYLITESGNPLKGYPPNWPTIDELPPNKDSEFYFTLNPNKAIFESRDEYQEWLALQLGNTSSPIYFPGAPNDPMLFDYDSLVESDQEKQQFVAWRAAQTKAPKTLFSTEKKWMDFLNSRLSLDKRKVPCGGYQQCGIEMALVNDPEKVINCSSKAYFQEAEGGPTPPEKPWEGTAKIKQIPVTLPGAYAATRFLKSNDVYPFQSPYDISNTGNLVFNGNWTNDVKPVDKNKPQINAGFSFARMPYVNATQKGCQQFLKAVTDLGFAIEWTVLSGALFIGHPDIYSDIEGWPPGHADYSTMVDDKIWFEKVPATFTQSENTLTWVGEAIYSYEGEQDNAHGNMSVTVTLKFKDL